MRAAGLFMLVLLCGCGAPIPRVPDPGEVQRLPRVTVALSPEIEAERAQVFHEQDGATRLQNAVLDELIAHPPASALTPRDELRVLVTHFRLRSTASGVWAGAMAGADMLDVSVAIAQGDKTMRTFTTGVGGLAAGLVKPTAEGRFNGLVREVAQRIVKEL